jgi:hypothetical protein
MSYLHGGRVRAYTLLLVQVNPLSGSTLLLMRKIVCR